MVSAAHRTVGTWQSVAAGGGFDLEPSLSEVLYGAGPETALDLLRETPDDVTAVIVIGHNPTMASLASLIDDGDGDPAVTSEMLSGYPTSAVALFEYDGCWSDLDRGRRPPRRLPRRPRLTPTRLRSGERGWSRPSAASAASISSRLMPRMYMIASR